MFLLSAPAGTSVSTFWPDDVVYYQGDRSDSVMYLEKGTVELSVLSRAGKETVVAILDPGAFFGESALAGCRFRNEMATAMTATTVVMIAKAAMPRLLHEQHAFSNWFIRHTLARNIPMEEDLVDQLFDSSDKRLARKLLLLAHYGKADEAQRLPFRISQQTLAGMIGTSRSRVNVFMNRFRKLGHIEYRGGLKVNDSLVSVLLQDDRTSVRPSKAV